MAAVHLGHTLWAQKEEEEHNYTLLSVSVGSYRIDSTHPDM